MSKDQKLGHQDLSRMALWFVFAQHYPYQKYKSSYYNDTEKIDTPILQEDNAAVKAERVKPGEKKTWQSGVKAWARKHGMTFDTLKTLQFAGWLSMLIAFNFSFQYSERVILPLLSLLASLLYVALALAFYSELL